MSHELFLKTDAYFLSPSQASEFYLLNGTFDTSENAITWDRITDASISGPKGKETIENTNYYLKDNITYFQFQSGGEGVAFPKKAPMCEGYPQSLKDSRETLWAMGELQYLIFSFLFTV